jgi:uncharacterized damage-inducible protein DinB
MSGQPIHQSLYTISNRELLKYLAEYNGGFHRPEAVLEGLTEEHATTKPHGLPHSIADIVGHMCFWQEFFNRVAVDGFTGFPEHAPEGWPETPAGGWNELRQRFLNSVEHTQQLALSCETLDEPLLPEGLPIPVFQQDSIGTGLLHAVLHNSHHLGQIVTMRQLMGLWPPGAGSMTW